ncbi:TPA: hypothetical protein ACH3X1_013338 [Trebouxia sp. C0004]
MQPEQPTTIQRVLESFERSLSMTDSPSSAALPAAGPGGSDPSADAATIAAAAAAAATPSAATGSDVTTKDYYAFRGETVKLLNHFGTVVTSIQQQQISQAASLTEVSGRLAPENLGSVIAGQLQPALKQFSDIVTKNISAAMNPTAINTMVVAALAAQLPQVSAQAAAPTSSFYSFGPALAPTNPIVQLPGYEVAPTAAPLTLASTSDAEMFLPEEAPQTTSLNKFWVGLQACYDNWGYPWLFGCYKVLQEESADRHQEVQAFIRNLQADLPNRQAATPTLVMQPPITSYDDNSTTGVGSLSTSTKKQRTNSGTAQATGYKTAVQQPTRPSPRAHRMQVCGTPQNLLKGIVVGQDPGEYALASYCSGAPPDTAAKMPPQLGKPGSANRCWTNGCNGHNPNSTEPHTQWTKCHLAKVWFANLGKQQQQQACGAWPTR